VLFFSFQQGVIAQARSPAPIAAEKNQRLSERERVNFRYLETVPSRNPFLGGTVMSPVRNGHILLLGSAGMLIVSGLFALYLAATGQFLPHDEAFLGMTAKGLCSLHGCRIVHFMVHDRISFGGALISIGLIYVWLIMNPLRHGAAWPWWVLLLSSLEGFGSFFAYLGYGYLDTWHGIATLGLLPMFAVGMVRAYRAPDLQEGTRWGRSMPWHSPAGLGRALLLATATGMTVGGFTIMAIGTTCVFVPQDLQYMDLSVAELQALNPRLIPLIAHDRAGFGGGVCCCGMAILGCLWFSDLSRSLWSILALVGLVGFGCALGAHPAVGYNDPVHLAPAACGALSYLTGLLLTARSGRNPNESSTRLVPA
jgi:hypothetical protein